MTTVNGALIGFFGGLLTGPLMLVWLIGSSFISSDIYMGSTAVLGPFMWGIEATILGLLVGTLVGAVLGVRGVQFRTRRSWAKFGAAVMGSVGILIAALTSAQGSGSFKWATLLMIGMFVFAPALAGGTVGYVAGLLGGEDQTRTGGSGSSAP